MTENMIVAIISGVLALIPLIFNAYRESKLKRITDERTKWREEIRKIANDLSDVLHLDIETHTCNELYNALNRLKVRINSYGKNSDDVHKDSHIWKSIETIEKVGLKNGKEEIQKLIVYLSLLLKFDWERSKSEASFCFENILGYAFSIVATVWYIYFNLTYKNDNGLIIISFVYFVSLIIFPYFMMLINDIVNIEKERLMNFWGRIIIIISLFVVIFVYPSYISLDYLIYPPLLLFIAEIFFARGYYKEIKAYNEYKNAVFSEKTANHEKTENIDK